MYFPRDPRGRQDNHSALKQSTWHKISLVRKRPYPKVDQVESQRDCRARAAVLSCQHLLIRNELADTGARPPALANAKAAAYPLGWSSIRAREKKEKRKKNKLKDSREDNFMTPTFEFIRKILSIDSHGCKAMNDEKESEVQMITLSTIGKGPVGPGQCSEGKKSRDIEGFPHLPLEKGQEPLFFSE